ncbi:MAG: hypothetical protein VB055_06225 [Oscillospiraceae bacterium]|nr:hypothetical protein [Oscillospiraceae bacterium]
MSELKPCQIGPKQAAEKLQESYDYMTSVMPEGKRSQATIDLLAAMSYAISACRAQPDNEPLSLDELREMDGEPVWCAEKQEWMLYRASVDRLSDGEYMFVPVNLTLYAHKPGGELDGH